MSKDKLVKAAGSIMIISLVSKLIGFFRDALIASTYGLTYRTDAYVMSLTIPNLLFGLFGLAITTTFIPILSESYRKNGKEDMFNFSNSIMNILMIISLILCIVGWTFTPQLVKLIATNFKGQTYALTVQLTKLSMINILFLSLNSGYMAILQTLEEFTAPALVGIIMNIPIILYILLGNKYGIVGLTIATIIGDGLQILTQVPWLKKNKYRYNFKIDFKDSRINKMFLLIAPVIIGTGVNQINTLVQNNMASGLPAGSVAALDYANKLNGLVYFTFAAAIVTVIYPSLSREGISDDYTVFKQHICDAVNNINLIMIPATTGLIVLRVPIISILFMHGAFDKAAVDKTSVALFFLASGMIFWGIRDVFNRAFYALQDTKTPMINGVIGVSVNILLSILLVEKMGIGGLTLATTMSALVSCVFLVKDLRAKIGNVNGVNMFKTGLKIVISSTIMGVVIFFINNRLNTYLFGLKGEILILIISIIVGVISYSLVLYLLRVKEFIAAVNFLKMKIKKS